VVTELGPSPSGEQLDALSPALKVTPETPPTFLMHTEEDTAVPVENSLEFYRALRQAGVAGELHVYQKGPHGAGLGNGIHGAARAGGMKYWSLEAERWLQRNWMADHPISLSAVFRL
jgi:acetyl esterase/lipase